MKQQVEAVFENGVLRPLEPLTLAEHEHVMLSVTTGVDTWLDLEFMEQAKAEADPTISIEQVRKELAAIRGNLSDAVNEDRGEY